MCYWLYFEISILCVFLNILILNKMNKNIDKQIENVIFVYLTIAILIIFLIDIIWILIENNSGYFFRILNNIFNAFYMFELGAVFYFWMIFIESKLKNTSVFLYLPNQRMLPFLFFFPLIILFVLSFLSIWNGMLFYIDNNNISHIGSCYLILILICGGYMLFAFLDVMTHLRKEKNYQKNKEYIMLLIFNFLNFICIIVARDKFMIPVVWPVMIFSLLIIYLNFQEYQISTDGLTGLNNRRIFDRYLYNMMTKNHISGKIFLFIMDIDSFKEINDTYGHVEGDNILINVASILKEVCNSIDAFLSRYGGDEFAVIFKCKKESEAAQMKEIFYEAIRGNILSFKIKMHVSISIGYAEYIPEKMASADEFIKAADHALYEDKSKNKSRSVKEI